MTSATKTMQIDQIQHAGDTQIRVQLDLYAVEDYARAMQDGDIFPPIDVFFDGSIYWLADGFHRTESATRLGKDTIDAKIHQGGRREAILFAIDTNRRYGVRLNNKDKQKIINLFLKDSEWVTWSNVEIAKICGIDQSTVKRHRDAILCIAKDKKPNKRKYRRNGKTHTMNTENLGKSTPAEPEPPQETLFADAPASDTMEVEPVSPVSEPTQTQCEDKPEDAEKQPTVIVKSEPLIETEVNEPEPTVTVETIEPEPAIVQPVSHIEIINADAQFLSQLVTEPVHLVVTSPPYNVGIDYDNSSDDLLIYIPIITEVWKQCYQVMESGARIAVVVPFGVGRNPYVPFDSQIMQTLIDAGFTLRGRIIWDKNTTGNRTSWGSFRLPSDPSIRDTTECIIVAHKGQSKLEIPDEVKQSDEKGTHTAWLADSDYFMGLAQDHWVIAPESAQRVKHPAPFPVELAERLIRFYAYPGAHILDPFGGSGSVGVAAKKLGCDATLIEISQQYCELAKGRINQ